MTLSAAAFFVVALILLLANLVALRHRARFALSLERGGAIYLSGLMGKSHYCCVVRQAERAYHLEAQIITDENKTIPNQLEALIPYNVSPLPAASRSDARV